MKKNNLALQQAFRAAGDGSAPSVLVFLTRCVVRWCL